MNNSIARCVVVVAALACAGAQAKDALVLLAPNNNAMPIARFDNGVLTGGFMKDVGEAIAMRLGRAVRFVTVPSRRAPLALSEGGADGLCYVQPAWIDGDFNWTRPFIPSGGTVVARSDAPRLHSLSQLRDVPVGTVAGYRYAQLEALLGAHFVRKDAPSMQHNLEKLLVGRTQYAAIELATAEHALRDEGKGRLRIDLEYEKFMAQCAFSKHSAVPFADIKHAVDGLIDDGSIARIMARYR
ncbi:MAG: transporter substrate-binding domain-containing protein [Pseudomonadota bacterium]